MAHGCRQLNHVECLLHLDLARFAAGMRRGFGRSKSCILRCFTSVFATVPPLSLARDFGLHFTLLQSFLYSMGLIPWVFAHFTVSFSLSDCFVGILWFRSFFVLLPFRLRVFFCMCGGGGNNNVHVVCPHQCTPNLFPSPLTLTSSHSASPKPQNLFPKPLKK